MEENKTIVEIEKELLLAYIAKYGGGHSVTRQFRSFLMNSPRAGEARRMLTGAADEMKAAAKEATSNQPGMRLTMPPAKSPSQPLPQQTLPEQLQQEPPKETAGAAGVAAVDSAPDSIFKTDPDLAIILNRMRMDIAEGLSNVQIAAKYSRKDILAFSDIINAEIDKETMSEKQIVAAIKKALK